MRLLTAARKAGSLSGQRALYQRQCDDQGHANNGASADAVHTRTSYSNATPSGSFSSNQVSAASVGGEDLDVLGIANRLLVST
ncbi:hypothetical protein CQ10_34135 [Bradyrhizobium valentinum]|nr:hypothetical protein CQ10_34135 [Bradyrhizobium valentinum]